MLALLEEDEECLEIMAKEFQNARAGLINHIYWGRLDQTAEAMKSQKGNGDNGELPDCSLM